MVRVVIYSDQPVLAAGLAGVIAADPELILAGCCAKISALKGCLEKGRLDLAVLDETPQMTYETLRELRDLASDCKLILWTRSIAIDFAMQALTIGVRAVLRKTLSLESHRECLHRVHSGELWFEKTLTDSFRTSRCVALTPRESQLVTMLSQGLKNKEISAELGITEGTVKAYLSHLFHKSGTKDRLELALYGLKNFSSRGIAVESQHRLRSLVMEQPAWTLQNPTGLSSRRPGC